MKNRHYFSGAPALLVAAALCIFTPGLFAQSAHQAQPPAQQSHARPQIQTFTGKIMKLKDGKYALITGKTPQGQVTGHFLDDPADAKKYDGKKVKVTGRLDMASNTIHVTNIAAA